MLFSKEAAGWLDEAEASYQEAAEIRRKALAENESPEAGRILAVALERLGDTARAKGDFDAAMKWYTEEAGLYQKVLDRTGTDAARHDLSIAYNKIGVLYKDQGLTGKALAYYTKAREITDALASSEAVSPAILRSSFIDNLKIGEALEAQNKLDEALEVYDRICPMARSLREAAPSDQAERDYFIALIKLGDIAYKKMVPVLEVVH